MLALGKEGYWMPFPNIPETICGKYSVNGLDIRPFGQFKYDLEIDFNEKNRPKLITQIIECCVQDGDGRRPEQAFFWDLTVGKRIESLMAIAVLGKLSGLQVNLRCLNVTCHELLEIELTRQEIADLQRRGDEAGSFEVKVNGQRVQLRNPTGNDQLEWLKNQFPDEDTAIRGMILSLAVNGENEGDKQEIVLSDESFEAINEVMDEFDPLVNFNLTIQCPHCGKEDVYSVDLEDRLLRELETAQQNLLKSVHRLASCYHWNEQEIFSIPPWRRSHYLAMIEKEGPR